ncbi:sugar isomerase (SIS) [Thermocrinis albus DSM 14484]|uniref:Phosphoheptose isomerase n=1 Tax=Thermocrinis albus (strain DSM 14484 / JCM 11386 / HI 11/12) TaxID=638303 RepID=D3SM84_THEAH|nr:D-sedoheptulose 7-phosphate isomerase [Thermocrinis albus]ADC89864.1 sugar isomerase (SIS) [Thermocrinis albus DSM 14484]
MLDLVKKAFKESADVKLAFVELYAERILEVGLIIATAIKDGNKVILFGNGGSAADAQHIAAELIGRFKEDRKPLPAIALTTDTSVLTALGNDYGFESIFERQVEALCMPGDVVIGITTSGNSPNVVRALAKAHDLGALTVAFTGRNGGKVVDVAHYSFVVPSYETPRIQECHITLGHVLCEIVERELGLA